MAALKWPHLIVDTTRQHVRSSRLVVEPELLHDVIELAGPYVAFEPVSHHQSRFVLGRCADSVYGVSRQSAHRRFSDETIVPSDVFDQLLEDLDEDGEVVPSLERAAKRVRGASNA